MREVEGRVDFLSGKRTTDVYRDRQAQKLQKQAKKDGP
jgi:hypothetical protein